MPRNASAAGAVSGSVPAMCSSFVERESLQLEEAEDDLDDDDPFGDDDDDDDGFSDDTSMVMSLKDRNDCIGCEACSKICPKGCFSHMTAAA